MRKTSLAFVLVALLSLYACQNNGEDSVATPKTTQLDRGKASLADEQVARVGASFIYQSDIDRLAVERELAIEGEGLSTDNPQYTVVLKDLINQRLLATEAIKRSVDQSSENKRRLAAARERVLSSLVTERVLREAVTEENILRLYNEQAVLANRGNEVRARHIVVANEKKAKEVMASLEEGGDFGDLALIHSLDTSSKDKGGDLGWITRDRLATDLTQVLFSTETGERTEIFKTDAGWHIADVTQRRAPQGQDYESVKPKIRSFLIYEAIDGLINQLRNDTDIEMLYKVEDTKSDPAIIPENQDSDDMNDTIEVNDG